MKSIWKLLSAAAGIAVVALVVGCTGPSTPPKGGTTAAAAEDHEHGPHDGVIVEWGDEEYHVEFTPDHDKQEAKVYIYGPDHKNFKPAPIKADKVRLTIKDPKIEVELKPEKQAGDPEGTASVFVGKHEKLAVKKEYEGTISAEFGGKQYNGDFKEEADHDHKHKK